MRNIKTSLRFVRNSALLFVAVSGVTYLTGCQSENGLNSGNNEPLPEASLSTAPYTVYGANQNRVRNHGGASTRAGEYVEAAKSFDMPESVVVPEGIATTTGIGTNDGYKIEAGVDYLIPKDEVFDAQFKPTANYYVAGTYNCVNGFWDPQGAKPVIYVLPGGVLNLGSTLQPGITIYNYGTIKSDNGICISKGVKLYSAVDIVDVPSFGVNSNDGDWDTTPAGEFYSRGSVMADGEVRLNGNVAACAFIANTIKIHDKGTVKASYFKANDLDLNTGYVFLDNNGLVDVKNLFISNADTRFYVNGTNAVVYAESYGTNNIDWPADHFGEGIACKFDKSSIGSSEVAFNELGLQYSSADQVAYVPAAGCHGSFDYNGGDIKRDEEDPEPPVTPDEPIVEIRKIVDIESLDEEVHKGDHDHGIISATCINFGADGTAYASYHLRGNGTGDHNQPNYVDEYAQKGCIEVIKYNAAGEFELGSYMISPDWDFNHLIVDDNRIITVGNAKKLGAFIGSLPVDFAASQTATRDDFKVKELTTNIPYYGNKDEDKVESTLKPGEYQKLGYTNAGDGNCVVRQGDYYYVATYEGYGPIKASDFSKVLDNDGNKIFHKTNGSCKHISVSGDKMAVLAHDTYDKTSSTASLYMFNASDYSFANQLAKYDNVGTIAPVDGKNVIAIDGNDVYVCLSKGGLARYTNGALNGTFQRGKNGNVPVNGMAFDENYIYVANGSFVSVLDKATMNEICYYHAASQKSANYIALRNNKIYVAFGEDGIQVFQLVQKEISQN